MPYCKNCGKGIEEGTKFCPHCGTACDGSPSSVSAGVDYSELKFSGSVVGIDKNLRIGTILMYIMLAVGFIHAILYLIFYGDLIFGGRGAWVIFYLFIYGIPAIAYVLAAPVLFLYFLGRHLSKMSYALNENSTLKDLKNKSNAAKFMSVATILNVFLCAVILFNDFIDTSPENFVTSPLWIMLREPELYCLLYGTGKCVINYYTFIVMFIYIGVFVFECVIQNMTERINSYFKGKLVEDMSNPVGKKAPAAEREEYERKMDEIGELQLGEEYLKAVAVYNKCFNEKREPGYDIKREAVVTKYLRIKSIPKVALILTVAAVFMLWSSIGTAYSSRTVRAGSAAKIHLGDTASVVEDKLGKPDLGSSPYNYVYTDSGKLDNLDNIENVEDLEDLFNTEIKQISIFFVDGKVTDVRYDAGKSLNIFAQDYVKWKEIVRDGEAVGYVHLYKDGSLRIYEKGRQ